jgi:HAD superfamily hydrolase (TIGR01490 family)
VYGFFDIDDTLTQGITIISFAEFLFQQGFVAPDIWTNVQADLAKYKSSDKGESAYLDFATDILDHIASGLTGKTVNSVRSKAEEFFQAALAGEVQGYKIHTFSKELIARVKSVGIAVAISGSPEEVLEPLARYLGFDQLEATIFEKENGSFTGKVSRNLAIDTQKTEVVSQYSDVADYERSYAFGDSMHDIPLMNAAGNKFVLGNNPVLHGIAQANGWNVLPNGEGILERIVV